MTVTYSHDVATGSKLFGNFGKLLMRWKGSIYKLVMRDLIIYALLYFIINIMYRVWLADKSEDDTRKKTFHAIVDYAINVVSVIPLQFMLSFYVSQIVVRWWNMYMTIPSPLTLSIMLASRLRGGDERGRMMRRTIVRYVNLSLVMVFTMVSRQIRKRFPTLDHLVIAGFLEEHEKIIMENLNEKWDGPMYFVPIVWAAAVAKRARFEKRILDDGTCYQIISRLCMLRQSLGEILCYDWVCTPLAYTQAVTLCTYVYFLACLFGKQLILTPDSFDMYFPIFHFLEFFFFMGWLRVAETLINPFGEDDDDFEVNWLVDRNIMISYIIVDEMHKEFPEMLKDVYWDDILPDELYYTPEALKYKTEGMGQGSAAIKDNEEKEKLKFSDPQPSVDSVKANSHPFYGRKANTNLDDDVYVVSSTASGEVDQRSSKSSEGYEQFLDRSFVPYEGEKESSDEEYAEPKERRRPLNLPDL